MSRWIVGAALRSENLPPHLTWLLEKQRDLELQDPVDFEFLDGDWQSRAREIRAMLDGYHGRLGVHGPFSGFTIGVLDPKMREVVRYRLHQALDFCAAIGATHMVLHSPLDNLNTALIPRPVVINNMEFFRRTHLTLPPVIEHAQAINCTLMIENLYDTDPSLHVALVRSFASDFVRVSLDSGHAYANNTMGAPPPQSWVYEAGELLGHLHLQDTDSYNDRHWIPGAGSVDWPALFAALNTLPHQPRLLLELHDHTRIGAGALWLAEQGLAI